MASPIDFNTARTSARQFGDGTTYALDFEQNGQKYTFVPSNLVQNGGVTAGDNTYLLPYFTDQKNLDSFSKDAQKTDLSDTGLANYLKSQGQSTQGFLIPSDKVAFDSQVLTQPTSTLNGSLNGLKKEGNQIVYGVTGGGGSRYLTTSGEVHNPTTTYSSILGDVFGGVGQTLANAWQDLGPIGQIAAAYYGGGAIADALGAGTAGAEIGAANDLTAASDYANAFQNAPQFTAELPAGAAYTAPAATTLGNVAGTTEGMASGTALSDVAGNADKAALLGDAGYGAGMTGAETSAYDTALGAGVAAGAAGAAGGAAGGTALADILPYTAGAGLVSSALQANAAQSAADQQTAAANAAIAQQQKNFETINAQQAPYRAAGYNSLNDIAGLTTGQTPQYDANGNIVKDANGNPVMIAGSGYLQHQFDATDLAKGLAPNYDFMLQQGQMANQRAANAGGGALGGNALQGLNKYTQDYAGNAYQNAFNNYQSQRKDIYNTLAGIAGIGQTGQTATNTAATNATNAATQLGVGSAGAQAAAQTGSANAYTNAINNATNNYTLAALLNQRGNVQMPIG